MLRKLALRLPKDAKPTIYTSILATILVLTVLSSIATNDADGTDKPDPFQGFSKVNVQFSTRPNVSPLIIDDILYLAEDLPVSFEWIAGSKHTIEIPETEVFDENGIKYIFYGWNDLDKNAKREFKFNEDFHYIAYFRKESSGSGPGKEFTVTFDSFPRESAIIIDGRIYLPTQLPQEFKWIYGSNHTVSLPESIIPAGDQTRYVFSGWNDFNKDVHRFIKVDGDAFYTAVFNTQYMLKIDSPFGSPKGQGWYDAYDSASISIDPIMQIIPGKKRVFSVGWSDGDNRYSTENTVTMSAPKTINAIWKTQYFVSITSHIEGPKVKGTGWHDEKSQILIAADSGYEPIANNHKFEFSHWVNVGHNRAVIEDSKSPMTTLTVTDYLSLEANYDEFFYLKIKSPYGNPFGEGYYRAGEVAKVAVTTPFNVIPDESRFVFDGWSGASNSKESQIDVMMDGYKELVANWKEQYYLKTISRYPGVEGAGWYDKGSIAEFAVHNPQNGGIGRQILFQEWIGDYQGNSKKGTILMDRPYTVIANHHEDFTLLYYLVAAIVAIIALPTLLYLKSIVLGKYIRSHNLKKEKTENRSKKSRWSRIKLEW